MAQYNYSVMHKAYIYLSGKDLQSDMSPSPENLMKIYTI